MLKWRLLALLLVVALLVTGWQTGLFADLDKPRQLADALVAMGPRGYLAFVVSYALLQPFGIPGTVFVIAAPLIWPWPVAFALNMTGTMLASVIGFSFARFVARDWVSARIPARLHKYDAALQARALETTFLLRLILWMPQPLHYFLGVSKVPFWTHFWGSLFGYIPPLLMVSYLGGELFDEAGNLQTTGLPAMAALSGVSILLAVVLLRRGRTKPT
jgi:uncharacterized membrane protein YdjX (TVP38/TMEM64 family)